MRQWRRGRASRRFSRHARSRVARGLAAHAGVFFPKAFDVFSRVASARLLVVRARRLRLRHKDPRALAPDRTPAAHDGIQAHHERASGAPFDVAPPRPAPSPRSRRAPRSLSRLPRRRRRPMAPRARATRHRGPRFSRAPPRARASAPRASRDRASPPEPRPDHAPAAPRLRSSAGSSEGPAHVLQRGPEGGRRHLPLGRHHHRTVGLALPGRPLLRRHPRACPPPQPPPLVDARPDRASPRDRRPDERVARLDRTRVARRARAPPTRLVFFPSIRPLASVVVAHAPAVRIFFFFSSPSPLARERNADPPARGIAAMHAPPPPPRRPSPHPPRPDPRATTRR